MATVNQDVFQKFQKLTTRQEGDGHEIQVEVREDEEQSVKLQEIIDLLVAAGYFRARIKGLSPFDKVVGGMTWCIESCNVDVDVDLLFQENSTIGQKIALTEKIVAVLPKIKCPYQVEPHQIQGLDFIHIFPVIQWLVKRSMEFRQEMSAFVSSYAVNQFNKNFSIPNREVNVWKQVLENVNIVTELYRPHRYYRRKTAPPNDFHSKVQLTLLEYGQRGETRGVVANSLTEEDVLEEQKAEELHIQQLLSSMALTEEAENFILNEEEQKVVLNHYVALQSEMEDSGTKSREVKKLEAMERQKLIIAEKCSNLQAETQELQQQLSEHKETLKKLQERQEQVKEKLENLEQKCPVKDPKMVKEIEELIVLNDNLRSQESQFREHCRQELQKLQKLIEETKNAKTPIESTSTHSKEYEEETEELKVLRLRLAKKNRNIAALQRQLDEVPSRAELAQYQRRFLELYNQVAAKHKETKQYYTLYNTLEDTKSYMKKELTLLNSISENYPEAMMSSSSKEEFIKQLENIVEGVRQSKMKVERKLAEEKEQRDKLSHNLQSLVEQQRRYVAAVRQLSIECRRHEALLTEHKT